MAIKFNCSNPECRQRIEVQEAMAGNSVPCPRCGLTLVVPASHDVRFNCANPECGQHVVVDISEAGRFVKCPSCGRVLRVPGDPPKPLVTPPASVCSTVELTERRSYVPDFSSLTPFGRLALGWGAGAAFLGFVLLALHLRIQAALPPRLNQIADEIYHHKGTNFQGRFSRLVAPVVKIGTNERGETFQWYFVPPANLQAGRKYPALVDETSSAKNDHPRDIQFLANTGIFYVSPNSLGITKWGITPEHENTRAVYTELLKDSNVDQNRIYVCGHSYTTIDTCTVVDENPALWRGVILLEPVHYPRIPAKIEKFPSVFISMGFADRYNQGFLGPGNGENWLRRASARFIPARINYQPGGHGYQPEQLEAAYMAAVKFILTDY